MYCICMSYDLTVLFFFFNFGSLLQEGQYHFPLGGWRNLRRYRIFDSLLLYLAYTSYLQNVLLFWVGHLRILSQCCSQSIHHFILKLVRIFHVYQYKNKTFLCLSGEKDYNISHDSSDKILQCF